MGTSGVIFDIQRFAVHDGPGIRSTVFLKGCSCRCAWCHNPESFAVKGQIEFYPSRCIACGACFKNCPQHAHSTDIHRIDRSRCTGCGRCAAECHAGALIMKGRNVTSDEVLETIRADKVYYLESGGGVTFSGGEPVLQDAFVREILTACKKEGLHTALQTAGNYPYPLLESLLPYLDMIMYDIKGFSPRIYEHFIHGNRDVMLGNLSRVSKDFKGTFAVRTPVISPVNDTEDEIGQIVMMLSALPRLDYYQLLPYHGLGKAKYDALDIGFALDLSAPPQKKIEELERFASLYVPVYNQDKGMLDTNSR